MGSINIPIPRSLLTIKEKKVSRCEKIYEENALFSSLSNELYNHVKVNNFDPGLFLLKYKSNEYNTLLSYCQVTLDYLGKSSKYEIAAIYIDKYINGGYYSRFRSYRGCHQLMLTLGAKRTIQFSRKTIEVEHGSAIIFGQCQHKVTPSKEKDGTVFIIASMKQK